MLLRTARDAVVAPTGLSAPGHVAVVFAVMAVEADLNEALHQASSPPLMDDPVIGSLASWVNRIGLATAERLPVDTKLRRFADAIGVSPDFGQSTLQALGVLIDSRHHLVHWSPEVLQSDAAAPSDRMAGQSSVPDQSAVALVRQLRSRLGLTDAPLSWSASMILGRSQSGAWAYSTALASIRLVHNWVPALARDFLWWRFEKHVEDLPPGVE